MEKERYYVKKAELQEALINYQVACREAKDAGLEPPAVPEYLGDCFIKIATKLSYRPNFIGYTFREEMVSDGIETCFTGFRNYNAEKYDNPFAYFTKICWWAFLRRIAREKRELAKKYRYIENIDIHEMVTQEHDKGYFTNQFVEYLKSELDLVDIDKRVVSVKKPVKFSDDIEAITSELDFDENENDGVK